MVSLMKRCLSLGVVVLCTLSAVPAASHRLPEARRCPVFPSNNQWNLKVDDLPVHRNSDAIVRSIGLDEGLHPDFGSGRYNGAPIGIPYVTVGRDQRKVPISFEYDDESDPGPYPIPRDAPIEGAAIRPATGMWSLSTEPAASFTRCSPLIPRTGETGGAPDPEPRGISGPTICARRDGPPPMPQVSRYFPASLDSAT